MAEQRLITCSHCRSEIPYGANVCKGCRAEIKYGTPGFLIIAGLIIPIGAGWYVAAFLIRELGLNKNLGYIVWGVIALLGWVVAAKIFRKLFSNYVSFTRLKNQ
ncbi:hypothetical protein ACNZA9_003539 [Cronobacter sakazakii]